MRSPSGLRLHALSVAQDGLRPVSSGASAILPWSVPSRSSAFAIGLRRWAANDRSCRAFCFHFSHPPAATPSPSSSLFARLSYPPISGSRHAAHDSVRSDRPCAAFAAGLSTTVCRVKLVFASASWHVTDASSRDGHCCCIGTSLLSSSQRSASGQPRPRSSRLPANGGLTC